MYELQPVQFELVSSYFGHSKFKNTDIVRFSVWESDYSNSFLDDGQLCSSWRQIGENGCTDSIEEEKRKEKRKVNLPKTDCWQINNNSYNWEWQKSL